MGISVAFIHVRCYLLPSYIQIMSKPTPNQGSGRGRGRPSIGRPVTSRLSDEDHAFALALGDGGDALGIRRAVKIVASMGLEVAKELCRNLEQVSTEETEKKPRQKRTPKPQDSAPMAQIQTAGVVNIASSVANEQQELDTETDETYESPTGYMRHGT